jgi:cobalt-zinc-cadmium efflux system membrane fusion protein
MLNKVIHFSIKNKIVIGLFTLALMIWGGYSLTQLPIDAVPDITNNQAQIITNSPSLAAQEIERLVTLIGRKIGKDRTVHIHCHLDKKDVELLPGMYLKAYIDAGKQTVKALPNKAIVNFEGKDYISVSEGIDKNDGNYTFKMVKVNKGISELGHTEIIVSEGITAETSIVINGSYDLLAKIKNSEE